VNIIHNFILPYDGSDIPKTHFPHSLSPYQFKSYVHYETFKKR